jgi:hypothetical protein
MSDRRAHVWAAAGRGDRHRHRRGGGRPRRRHGATGHRGPQQLQALEHLLELSASSRATRTSTQVLLDCCGGIAGRSASSAWSSRSRPRTRISSRLHASFGWDDGPPAMSSLADVAQLCDPPTRSRAMLPWPADEATKRVGATARSLRVPRNGRGAAGLGPLTG